MKILAKHHRPGSLTAIGADADDGAHPGDAVNDSQSSPAGAQDSRARRTIWSRMGAYWTLLAWGLSIGVLSILSPHIFATSQNFKAILGEQSLLAIAALGATVVLICGEFDLSIGANIGVTGVITAGLMSFSHLPWGLAALVGLAVGTSIGCFNALLVSYFGVHSFIATLGTATILSGVATWYANGQIIYNGISPTFVEIAQQRVAGLPLPVFYMAGLTLVVWFVLGHTPFGRYLYAIGSNRAAAAVAGVRVKRTAGMALVACGALSGLVGVLQTSRTASAQTGGGDAFLLPAYAAAFIGAATFRRGQFNAVGTLVGVYFVATLVSGAFILGASDYVSSFISGGALIIAVIGLGIERSRAP